MKRFSAVVLLLLICICKNAYSQTETFISGSYIINMGASFQTVGNGLKPYGLAYELLKTHKVPVKWVIRSGKVKDAPDFTYGGVEFRGGTFIIPGEYITSSIAQRILWWEGQGVSGVYTNSSLTVPVSETLTSVPNWTLNSANISIAKKFFTAAGIPASAYNSNNPSALGACNDIFVMPHATPSWSQHGNLYNWNRNYKGAIWSGCNAVSMLENLVNPSDNSQRMNFLTTAGLMNFNSHAAGSVPYNYFFNRAAYNGAAITARADDPVFQMIGTEDAAHANGSEQIYIPAPGSHWRNTTHIGCYDSVQSNVTADEANGPAALTLYGRGFGLSTTGLVMYQSGHDIEGTGAANVAALRQFFNFSFEAMKDKVPVIAAYSIPQNIEADYPYVVSVSAVSPVGSGLSYQWSSTCPGTFINPNSPTAVFTPSFLDSNATYTITCVVTDNCARYSFKTVSVIRALPLPVTLLDFRAGLYNNDIQLKWTTTNEDNFSKFEVYRSFDGRSFRAIGNVRAADNNRELNNYSFSDANAREMSSEHVFYRLRMIDINDDYTWSKTLMVLTHKDEVALPVVSVFPNPVADLLNIAAGGLQGNDLSICVRDFSGREVMSLKHVELNPAGQFTLDVKDSEPGIYLLLLTDSDGHAATVKFIKR